MSMDKCISIEDVIGHMGTFLTPKETFLAARVNKAWFSAMFENKRKIFKDLREKTRICHLCGNCCPCVMEFSYPFIFTDFKLKRYMCSWVDNNPVPEWMHKYMGARKNLHI
jgi:hypothetical protein